MLEIKSLREMTRLTRAKFPPHGKLNLLLRRYSRRFRAYCVSTGKAGTNSIAGLFNLRYRSAHEPEADLVLDTVFAAASGLITEREIVEFVKKRDNRLRLELDSSTLNYWLLDILVKEFDDAKFILTIRDCYSWLNSVINHQLVWPASDNWMRFRNISYKPCEFKHAREELILAEHGLYTIDGYLSYWAKHNSRVLATVPKNRLLVIRTDKIAQKVGSIADFLDIPIGSLDISKSHSFKAKKDFGLILKIDRNFLDEKVDMHCRNLMDRYFPEL